MIRHVSRLRSQLILSHLAAIACTLVAMVAAVVLIAGGWIAAQQDSTGEPSQDARIVASAIGGLATRDDASTALNVVLRAMASGSLRVLGGPNPNAPDQAPRFVRFGSSLDDVAYIVVVGHDGQPLASSEPTGAAFAPPERLEWHVLAQEALAGVRDPRRLVSDRSGGGPAALGAYPILNERGQPVAAVVVATRTLPSPTHGGSFWQGLAIFGAASLAVLVAASLFALVSASVVGYLLSRRLVARLERLGRAAESLAAGDLSRRVEEGPADEVGRLMRQFNHMADQLAATVAALEAAKGRTEATLRAKRELVANVSHELRTPLALIRSHAESLLLRGGDHEGERRREYLAVINRETEHLSRLIDDLFALSTAEAGALPLALEPVALAELVEEVARGIRPIARRERQVSVATEVAPDLPPALADRQRVVQVLGNLVRNALRYTPEGGLIAIRAEPRDGRASIAVEDTGIGIPPDQLPHVFERFYRGDDARDRASGGAGLGLAIVRELVEAMGGDVSVESTVGQGSCFAFSLPLATGAVGMSAATSARHTATVWAAHSSNAWKGGLDG
ncbi:MAG TPA: ATP-binding protein [Chloroflexota bacterium]|nr:ATP-binding protein [Chloroflexota bacterium]